MTAFACPSCLSARSRPLLWSSLGYVMFSLLRLWGTGNIIEIQPSHRKCWVLIIISYPSRSSTTYYVCFFAQKTDVGGRAPRCKHTVVVISGALPFIFSTYWKCSHITQQNASSSELRPTEQLRMVDYPNAISSLYSSWHMNINMFWMTYEDAFG